MRKWSFWVDRGGTFTDIIATSTTGDYVTHKLLSENPLHYSDAISYGIETLCAKQRIVLDNQHIERINIGTTVATNALLEHKGAGVLMVLNEGLADLLIIRDQSRRDLFQQHIERAAPLYQQVITTSARMRADGEELVALDQMAARTQLQSAYNEGIRAIAIALLHSVKNPHHEQQLGAIAAEIGFTTIVLSHQASPSPKLLPRAETTLIDAYLSPILKHYIEHLSARFQAIPLYFMQSNGTLVNSQEFSGKDAVLSGPAGGIVAMARTAQAAGFNQVVGFDMGGTSTDVSLFRGQFELANESEIAGCQLRVPMLAVHTVAAGGGSKLLFDGMKLAVGPESVGANPGPVSYGRGTELAVTDINVLCGKIRPEYFPNVFGPSGQEPLNVEACKTKFAQLTQTINQHLNTNFNEYQLANEYLAIAISSMANAIKTISTKRGIELDEYAINAFGGAGGQHACLVAEALGIDTIFVHAESSLLSAYGMGASAVAIEHEEYVGEPLSAHTCQQLLSSREQIFPHQQQQLEALPGTLEHSVECWLSYDNASVQIPVTLDTHNNMLQAFYHQYQQQFGYIDNDTAVVIHKACFQTQVQPPLVEPKHSKTRDATVNYHDVWFQQTKHRTPFIHSAAIAARVEGPAVIYDEHSTLVVEPNWTLEVIAKRHFVLKCRTKAKHKDLNDTQKTPARLEIFNNLFRHIASQMGAVLQTTAQSVNIKERLDFSCALFDRCGNLIANAPHMPVHLGSMSDSVKHVIKHNVAPIDGDSYILNSPYHGGTHLPDITVVTPVFYQQQLLFWVASRGHHADVGGSTPGSMPSDSQTIEQEGILIDNFLLVRKGKIREQALAELFLSGGFPVRNFKQNFADLKAQLAANQRGIQELTQACKDFGEQTVSAYMEYVQDYAAQTIRQLLPQLTTGSFTITMDSGAQISVTLTLDKHTQLNVDFSTSSPQQNNNFNAPRSVCRAAVLYVLRSLVDDNIPLNDGCMRPVVIQLSQHSILSPDYPAAVVAGNVETSQVITDALFGALGIQAAAQGTMNNLTFGNQTYQYYETVAGGSGAGNGYHGCDAIQTHMTNSRITDAEILESRFPVLVEAFAIRRDSGGGGIYKGGDGIIRRIKFLQPMTVNLLTNNRLQQPFGAQGGENGKTGENWLIQSNQNRSKLSSCCTVEVKHNDSIEIRTPGGGGFGKRH